MNFEEFLEPREPGAGDGGAAADVEEIESHGARDDRDDAAGETEVSDIEVQKAVVESLAADKAEQDELIARIKSNYERIQAEVEELKAEHERRQDEVRQMRDEMAAKENEVMQLKAKLAEQNKALANVGDVLSKNAETEGSNKISLLDRDVEVPDRFPGETRDHVLEVLAKAKVQAEADGRIRLAQILESVLKENEPSGNLVKRRAALEKLFKENQNLITGVVIEELKKCGLTHKNGESFLMASEIMQRNF